MSFRLIPKSMTSNDLGRRNRCHVALFYRIPQLWGQLSKKTSLKINPHWLRQKYSLKNLVLAICDLWQHSQRLPRTITYGPRSFAVSGPCQFCSLWTVCLEWSATDPACITRHTQTVSKHTVQPTGHDLALSWLFRPLEQRDINLLTYLLTLEEVLYAEGVLLFLTILFRPI